MLLILLLQVRVLRWVRALSTDQLVLQALEEASALAVNWLRTILILSILLRQGLLTNVRPLSTVCLSL